MTQTSGSDGCQTGFKELASRVRTNMPLFEDVGAPQTLKLWSGLKVEGSGFRIQALGFKIWVSGSGCGVQGSGSRVLGAGFRDKGFRV